MKQKYNFVGELILLLLSPILALPFIIYGMKSGNRKSYMLFSLFLSIVAYMMAPLSDLGRHYLLADYFSTMDWDTFKSYMQDQHDYISQFLEWWLVGQLKLPFEIIPMLEIIVAYSIINSIMNYYAQFIPSKDTNRIIFQRYIYYLLLFPFIILVSGVRFGIATIFLLYALHLLIDRNKYICSFFWFFTSLMMHFSMLYFLLPILLIVFIPLNKKRVVTLVSLSVLLSVALSSYVADLFIESDMKGAGYLGDGVWGNVTGKEFKTTALIYHWGQRLLLLPLISLLLFEFNRLKKWGNVLLAFLLLFIVFINYFSILQRTTVCLLIFSVFFLINVERSGFTIKKYVVKLLMFCAIISCSFDIYTHRGFINKSDYWRLIQPIPITLMQTYSKEWVIYNIN